VLPTYVIAGTVRSGTTSLHRALRRHPDVFAPGAKELHFFDRQFDRGVDWYESLFDGAQGTGPVGEATPNYLYDERAVARMAQVIPGARLVVLLRDPVERAYSQYWMQRSAHHETLDFADAVATEAERLRSTEPNARAYYSYVDRGRYFGQLQWLREYYPAEATLVLLYEDLRDRPEETFQTVCRFIGADPMQGPSGLDERANQHRTYRSDRLRQVTHQVRRHGPVGLAAAHLLAKANSRPTRYPEMDARTRARLEQEFAEPNAALANWLGRDLGEWAPRSRRLAR
jgi:hypothetical protein